MREPILLSDQLSDANCNSFSVRRSSEWMAAYSATKGHSNFIIMQDATTFGGFLSQQEEVSALSSSV